MKTTHFGVLFKKQSTVFLYLHAFVHKLDKKTAYMEISINWPLTYFVEYILLCNVNKMIELISMIIKFNVYHISQFSEVYPTFAYGVLG